MRPEGSYKTALIQTRAAELLRQATQAAAMLPGQKELGRLARPPRGAQVASDAKAAAAALEDADIKAGLTPGQTALFFTVELVDAEAVMEQAASAARTATQRADKAERECTALEKELGNLNRQLQEATDTAKQLRETLENNDQMIGGLGKKVDEANEKTEQAKARAKQAEDQIDGFREAAQDATAALAELNATITAFLAGDTSYFANIINGPYTELCQAISALETKVLGLDDQNLKDGAKALAEGLLANEISAALQTLDFSCFSALIPAQGEILALTLSNIIADGNLDVLNKPSTIRTSIEDALAQLLRGEIKQQCRKILRDTYKP